MTEACADCTPGLLLRLVPLSLWPEHVLARRRRLRRALERLEPLVDRCIAELDELTPEADMEPSLGAPEHPAHLSGLPRRTGDEAFQWARGEGEDREEDADREPSLGAPDWTMNGGGRDQRRWALGPSSDLEKDTSDDEPSLGSVTAPATGTLHRDASTGRAVGYTVNRDDQRAWALSGVTDAEGQCEGEGEEVDF